jgi:hypothetical protein
VSPAIRAGQPKEVVRDFCRKAIDEIKECLALYAQEKYNQQY